MAAPRLAKSLSKLKHQSRARLLAMKSGEKRKLHLEPLEDRRLMAQGPSLVAVIPNSGVFLQNNATLNEAPRELTFRFAQGNTIDSATLATGIVIDRPGPNGVFEPVGAASTDDIPVSLGFLGIGDTSREVIMRFAGNLPDDSYQITLVGIQPAGSSIDPRLKDAAGNPFVVNGVPANQTINLRLDLGAKVEAVVPQPITRTNNILSQGTSNTIEVYFDQQLLAGGDQQKPSFYRLIDATTGSIRLPQSVSTPVVDANKHSKVTLTFSSAIAAGTYKLEVGTTSERDDQVSLAQHVGNSMARPIQAFIGDNLVLSTSLQGNDVDLYKFEVHNPVTNFAFNVAPALGSSLDVHVRIFEADGVTEVVYAPDNTGNGGVAETASNIPLAPGTYYVGVSAVGNTNYSALSFSTNGNPSTGASTGAYSIQVTFGDLPANVDDTVAFNNSTFASASVLGVIGSAGKMVTNAAIGPHPDLSQYYSIQLPGTGDAPGDRNIPFQGHINTVPGRLPDPTSGIETITYDFQSVYGFSSDGQKYFNAISEAQKQRAREAFELYSRYLGVQFREVPDSALADITVATGDPRAVAPTISTNPGTNNNGVNGIAGVPSVISTSNVTNLQSSVSGPILNVDEFLIPGLNISPGGVRFGISIVSPNHSLKTGDLIQVSGVQGTASANGAWKITVIDDDRFFLDNSDANGNYTGGGTWTLLNVSPSVAIMNSLVDWQTSQYGGTYFQGVMNQIGKLLGLGDNYEAPALTIMGGGQTPSQASNTATAEPVFPGDADIVYGQTVHRPEGNDIDIYQFTVTESGLFRSETVANRSSSSLLDTVLTLYKQTPGTTGGTQIARNDDYYGTDSYLEVHLQPGTYYLAVTSVGNTEFDPNIPNSGFGGRTQGTYELTMTIKPDAGTTTMRDSGGVAFDGDADGVPGGMYQFWFQANTPANTIYVDKATTANQIPAQNPNLGTIGSPYRDLDDALAAAGATGSTKKIVRIVGNGGTDGNVNTLADNKAYIVGFKDPQRLQPLADGGEFNVPRGVTVMIDAGAIVKMRRSNLNAGTTDQGLVSRAGAAIQVLGTPTSQVTFTSYADDTAGGDSDGASSGALGGDYGGIVFRDDSDHERDFTFTAGSANNSLGLTMPVFLNYVNYATMRYGGGKVSVDSIESTYDPIHIATARPTVSYNTIQSSANAAVSANPNAFDDDGLVRPVTFGPGNQRLTEFDERRIGPEIHDNTLGSNTDTTRKNAINGLFVRIRTSSGSPIDYVDVPTRWDDTDITHVVAENLLISATPGGSASRGAGRTVSNDFDSRLRIDPGMIVKLSGSRIEAQISSQFIAEGTAAQPIIFTSLRDDKYGGSGTFDTNRDNSNSAPSPGNWGGLAFGAASSGSIAYAKIMFGGGDVPIEGGFDSFNAVEIHQADVRIVNSLLQLNDSGGSNTDRNGRGTNADATIFIRGAQPIIVNNIFRDNVGPLASINANAMTSAVVADYGQTTGLLNAVPNISDNRGPLIRGNRMTNNRLNGMVVRGGTLTTETVWDDTDIAHIVFDEIVVPNHQVFSGLRLQSTTSASLVVKLSGANAGFTASGQQLDINDRIGGTVQIIGQPGFPVVLTSISDDSISAGFDPSGLPTFDTDNTNGPLLTGPEINNATLIDNDVLTNAVGHFEIRPGAGGSVGLGVPNSQSGATAQGKSLLFTNQNFITQFLNYVDVGVDGGAIDLSASTILQAPMLAAPDLVVSEGTFQGENGLVKWHVETRFLNGATEATNSITFSSVTAQGAPSTTPLGNLRFINYLNENIQLANDDLLLQRGTPAVIPPPPIPPAPPTAPTPPGSDFRLVTLDNAQRVGLSQGGVYVAGPGLSNAIYDGFAADIFADLQNAITGPGAAFTLGGTIDLVDLPVLVDPALGTVNGLGNVTTAMSWTVTPTATTATITTFLGLIQQNPTSQGSPGDWRGVKLDQFSNDRNVGEVIETERGYVGSSGQNDNSRTPQSAQFIGDLAPNQKSGDDTRRLGFQIDGAIAYDFPADVDVYSFNANSGTEVWVDIDRTSYGLDAMIELVDSDGNVLARATDTNPNVIDAHDPNVPTDSGLTGTALSFNKDPFNGRDTYSTNAGANLLTNSGPIEDIVLTTLQRTVNTPGLPVVNITSVPVVIVSTNHGLVTGDQVFIEGVTGADSVNGVFIVTRVDANHFSLNGSLANDFYAGGGTWTRLVTATRDPIMRVVLPNGVNGPLTDAPFFIRVRSQPASFSGEAGNNLNPGLTSGQYQLQVRLQQKDEKPGSTIRFTDMRYATNAIEIQGLPYHSPLAGETVEGDNTNNDTFAGAQNLGNLLRVDRGTISVGGQISSSTDVDWYTFDLGFDLLQFVSSYNNGLKTWSTIFDLDYADGSVGGDFTISVFDQTGTLIFVGRDSDVADDQSESTATLGGGSFGKHDAFIGPAQLPAVVPGQTRRYFVAVSSDRSIPAVLDQTFNATATDSNIRLEPIEALSRVVSDPLEGFNISGIETGNQTAEFPSNLYVSQSNNQPVSNFIDTTSVQSLKANVKPFSLADVSLYVSGFESLYNLDATVGQTKAVAPALDFNATGPTTGAQSTDFLTGGSNVPGGVTGSFTSLQSGFAGSVTINIDFQDLGGNPATQPSGIDPTITVDNVSVPPVINIVLNGNDVNRANDVTGTITGTTAQQLLNVFQSSAAAAPARALVAFSLAGDPNAPIGSFSSGIPGPAPYSPLSLTGSNSGGPAPLVQFSARNVGPAGNQIGVTINRLNNGGIGPTVQVVGSQVTVNLDTMIPQGTPPVQSGTTIQQMINAIVASPANALIEVNLISGDPATDIANAGTSDPIVLDLEGGTFTPGSIEIAYQPRLTTSNQNQMADLSFRADGLLFGYEGVGIPGVNNTAGRLTQVNVAAGGSTTVGDDGIPDAPATPVMPPTLQSLQAIDSDLSVFSLGPPVTFQTGVGGMAWGGTTIGGIQNTLLFYSIPDDGPVRASRLYQANPNSGSAALVQNQPWGRKGNTITSATPATGQSDFGLPGSPVSVSFQTTLTGPTANGGVIRFSATDVNPPGNPPTITVNTAAPLDVSVVMNTNTETATKMFTFASSTNANNFTFTAGVNRPGGLGNDIVVIFEKEDDPVVLGTRGPKIKSINGSVITVTLDAAPGPNPDTGSPGTIASQLDALFDSLNVDPNSPNYEIIRVDYDGPGDNRIDQTPVTSVQLSGGKSATTAAELVAAINGTLFMGAPVLVASLSGVPTTQVALSPIVPFDVTLDGALGAPGYTTGLAFGPDEQTLYGITDEGQFLVNINKNTGLPARAVAVQIPDPSSPGLLLRGSNLRFQALTPGPQNLEDGRYANMFFAMTDTGILCALDSNGVPQLVFDTDNDGAADSVDIQTGLPQGELVTGLAFSPFDFNLWHPTFARQNDAGHSVSTGTPTNATNDGSGLGNFPTTGRGQDVNQSMQFGFENWVQIPGYTTSTYQTFPATGNANIAPHLGQLGMLSARTQRELSTNPAFNNTYDMPGGAYGSLITDKFSLATMSATDKPTFYFDYFLDTENINDAIQGQPDMRDSARVYIGPFTRTDTQGNSYTTWDLLATNNSVPDVAGSGIVDGEIPTFQSASVTALPANRRQQVQLLHDNTDAWRQSRVDLSRYAGQTNLQLRFDFTTAGQMPTSKGNLPTLADIGAFPPRFVTPGQEYLFEDAFGDFTDVDRGQNNDHQGFFVDNIMIGAAERGEMVTNAPANTDFISTPTPLDLNGSNPVPTQTLTGNYQLEIRRGAEYGLSENGIRGNLNGAGVGQTPLLLLNTNDRLIPDMRLGPAIPLQNFESQSFTTLPWNFSDDAPWTTALAVDLPAALVNPNGGSISAVSGAITNGQSSGLALDIITGNGNLTFGRAVSSATGDTLRLYIDGRLAKFTAVNGVSLASPANAQWSGNVSYQVITVPISAGHHSFRWTYDKDASDPNPNNAFDRAVIDDIQFPTPQIGFQNIYEDVTLHNPNNPSAISPTIGPTVPPPAAFAQILMLEALFPGFTRGGDENLERQQGHIQIEMNQIFASQQVGIFVDAAQRDANGNPTSSVRNLPVLNTQRLLPGVTIANNAISGSGVAGIHYSGDVNLAGQGLAAVPFGRIENNTIYGAEIPTGTGILVTQNAGPTLLNNIVAYTSVGISVDASSTPTTVIGATLYANNTANTPAGNSVGSNALFQVASDPLFINAATRNFYLQTGAKAINSAQDALPDRESLVTVKSVLGIPRSDILAPDFDLFGQFRLGEGSSGSGGGQNVTKDRGAVERADFLRPTATINDPLDNDTFNRDRDRDVDEVAIRNENLTQFVLKLNDVTGVGIDDATVNAKQFTLSLEDGTILREKDAALAAGLDPDYTFVYNSATDEAIFLPNAGIWPLNHTYKIKVNNNPLGSVDGMGLPNVGVLDRAGNSMEVNRDTGETFYTIFVGTLFDFGDAPAPYPVLLVDGGAAHVAVEGFFLGTAVTEESEGQPSPNATADDGDPADLENGVTITNVAPGVTNTIQVVASIPAGMTGRLDAWIDINRDGDWTDDGEKLNFIGNPTGALVDISVDVNTLSFTFGTLDTPKGPTFARFRLSSTGVNAASGPPAADGEVEDYRVNISGPPFQNPDLGGIMVAGMQVGNLDVTDSGNIAPSDALTVINFLNAFGASSLVFGPGPIVFDGGTNTITGDPAFQGPGQSVFIDVNGDTQLTADDALQVINFLNSPLYDLLNSGGGEGEGEGEAAGLARSVAENTAVPEGENTEIPLVLLASPDVVLEVRERTPPVALLAPSTNNAQDLALLALGSAHSRGAGNGIRLAASAKTKLPLGPLEGQGWDDLLTSLASDQENNE